MSLMLILESSPSIDDSIDAWLSAEEPRRAGRSDFCCASRTVDRGGETSCGRAPAETPPRYQQIARDNRATHQKPQL